MSMLGTDLPTPDQEKIFFSDRTKNDDDSKLHFDKPLRDVLVVLKVIGRDAVETKDEKDEAPCCIREVDDIR